MHPPSRRPRLFSLGCAALVSTWALLVFTTGRVVADNPDVQIREVMAGANGASSVQFLVIEQGSSGQNLWGPQGSETQSRAMLTFYDATGRETGIYKFPANPPTGGTLRTLVATADFAALLGAPAPDIIIPPLLQAISGKVCFSSNPSNQTASFRDCLSYGSFTGDTGNNIRSGAAVAAGGPAALLPITDTVSLRRAADSGRNADFALSTTPTPTNIAGATIAIAVDTQARQGERLFTQETFGGNGRTCATCHVPNQSFGLQPFDVQGRFATVGTTYDPLFVAETTLSGVTAPAGLFDYNLNILTLTAAVATGAPCTGELRGVVTAASTGGRAKVIARMSSTSYLVGGGISPALAGTVTDGTCSATVATVVSGSLGANASSVTPGLEDPRVMRTTRADNPPFLFGRALFLENIDRLTLDNTALAADPRVFRKSPHLLNMRFTAPFGFSGDIADLRTFSTGAVKQHYPRTLVRSSGGVSPDFRLPTAAELAAMEAFQLAQDFPSGTDPDKYNLDRFATSAAAIRGRAAFFGDVAKCSRCHGGSALSQMTVTVLSHAAGTNGRFNTGVVNQVFSNNTGRDNLPCEAGPSVGACGSREFSVPQLFNVKHLTPLFHDASAINVMTAVVFYNSPQFNASPAAAAIGEIHMPALANGCVPTTSLCTMIPDITAFLESLVARSLTSNSSTTATGFRGSAASPVPSVVVRDDDGNPVSGATVTFSVASGAGVVTGATAITNTSGVATVGGWVLGAGVNTLTANLEGATGSPVTFSAFGAASTATMSVDKPALVFGGVTNGVTFSAQTPAQTVRLTQAGAGSVTWTATSSTPWLTVSPASGAGSAALTISTQFATGLAASQAGTITLTFTGAANTLAPIGVTLRVLNNGASAAPFGSFDTPLDNTGGVSGSLAVTGWALDDVQVTRVRITRDAVAGETAGTQIPLGDAVFVEGARSDVAAGNSTAPLNTRAGWGYLLLSNFLPGLGNGTFRLSAYADDAEGRTTLLGSKTITCTNATATTPFGAIDTPGQGETVSGIVNNFGWVLSPGTRRADPPNGGTVSVLIDGTVVGTPAGWVNRADLAALFPVANFSGIANALGVYTFDSTLLANGVHTIAWVVTDNAGGAAGIGSRYFSVSNGTSLTLGPAPASRSSRAVTSQIASALQGRRGPDLSAPFTTLQAADDGVPTLQAEELDRIELRVQARAGRMRTPQGDRPLPVGSRLDPSDGRFTWQAGPGFVGAYDLVFDTAAGPRNARVVLNPQGRLSRTQVVVDLPSNESEIDHAFTVAGWALDPQAERGTGISTVHVWAYPAGGGLPSFLGAATVGGHRPDVARIYGSAFQGSGFGLTTSGLAPGIYDLAVFAWSDARGEFLPATVVRVTVR